MHLGMGVWCPDVGLSRAAALGVTGRKAS